MNIKIINAGDEWEAHDKWKEYVAQVKKDPKNAMLKDLRDVYNQAKFGRKLIDISEVLIAGGTRYHTTPEGGFTNGTVPKLAICSALSKTVICDYRMTGSVRYRPGSYWKTSQMFELPSKSLDTYTWTDGNLYRSKELHAPVPMIPKNVFKGKITDAHYILWEVDKWEVKFASEDPYLLKRITKNIFVILAHWELTPLEQLVMNEYL